ncbi:MAG: hypothetical protein ABIK28_10290 [Planctomycetota bacterium]
MNHGKDRIRLHEGLWLLLFGAAWGLNELLAGGAFYKAHPAAGSVWLVACGVLMLAMARALMNRTGSSLALALIAALFKSVNTQPFVCHILGILFLGLAFEVGFRIFSNSKQSDWVRKALTGAASVYLSQTLFAVVMALVLQSEYWIADHYAKMYDHILVTGSLAALAAACAVPLGNRAGGGLRVWSGCFPAWAMSSAALGTCVLWILGAI